MTRKGYGGSVAACIEQRDARRKAGIRQVVENRNRLVELLRGDYEEIVEERDIDVLRGAVRQRWHLPADEPVSDSMLYGGWLILKLESRKEPELVTLIPRVTVINGTFSTSRRVQPVIKPCYNGVYCRRCGRYTVGSAVTLRLMSMFVKEAPIRVTVLTPDGDFCDFTAAELQIVLND